MLKNSEVVLYSKTVKSILVVLIIYYLLLQITINNLSFVRGKIWRYNLPLYAHGLIGASFLDNIWPELATRPLFIPDIKGKIFDEFCANFPQFPAAMVCPKWHFNALSNYCSTVEY